LALGGPAGQCVCRPWPPLLPWQLSSPHLCKPKHRVSLPHSVTLGAWEWELGSFPTVSVCTPLGPWEASGAVCQPPVATTATLAYAHHYLATYQGPGQ